MSNFLRDLPQKSIELIADGFEWLFDFFRVPLRRLRESETQSWYGKLLLSVFAVGYWCFRAALQGVSFPFTAFFFPPIRRGYFLRGIPALGFFGCWLMVGMVYLYVQQRLENRYLSSARTALMRNQPEKSLLLGRRLVESSSLLSTEGKYVFAIALSRSGAADESQVVLETIAPDDRRGYASAHQMRAIEIGRLLSEGDADQQDLLPKMLWHLQHCGANQDERMHGLWARYYEMSGDRTNAIERLEKAGKSNPAYFVKLSEMHRDDGDPTSAQRALTDAVRGYTIQLQENPLSKILRMQLAVTLAKLKRWGEAESILTGGVQMHRDQEARGALADLYLNRVIEESDANSMSGAQPLELTFRALRVDVNHVRTYAFLLKLFDPSRSQDELDALRALLEERLVEGTNTPLAHFGLGLWFLMAQSKEQGTWHLKQAIRLDPAFAIASTNLAFAYMHSDSMRLDESLVLVQTVLEIEPNALAALEVLGAVLLARGELEEASVALLRVVSENPTNKGAHAMLARVYRASGDAGAAARHEALSQ